MRHSVDAHALRQRAEQLSATLPPLLVAAERVAATVVQGVHGRRRVGQGETFWQFRHYEFGDPPQIIDWRQSAKSDHVFTRQMEWEAAQSVWIWRDVSASMDWHSSERLPTKRERADLLALALAALLVRGGERVSLLGSTLRPAAGRGALTRLTNAMVRGEPGAAGAVADAVAPGAETGETASRDLPPRLALPRHAQVVFLGDLLAPLERIDQVVRSYAERGVNGHLLQILDPAEASLPFKGRIRFEGTEGEEPWLLSRVEPVREHYRARMAAHQEGLRAVARGVGWTLSLHHTDRSAESALLALYAGLSDDRRS